MMCWYHGMLWLLQTAPDASSELGLPLWQLQSKSSLLSQGVLSDISISSCLHTAVVGFLPGSDQLLTMSVGIFSSVALREGPALPTAEKITIVLLGTILAILLTCRFLIAFIMQLFLPYSWYDQGTVQQKKCYSWLACNNFVPSRYLLKIVGQYIHSYPLMLMCSALPQIPKSRAGLPKSQNIADWTRCWTKCLTSRWLKSTISWISLENFCLHVLIQESRSITLLAGQLFECWEYNVLDLYVYNFKRDTDVMTSLFFFFFLVLSCFTYFFFNSCWRY